MKRIERQQGLSIFEVKLNCRRILRILPAEIATSEETPYSYALQIIRLDKKEGAKDEWAINDGLPVFMRKEKMLEIREAVNEAIIQEEKRAEFKAEK